MEVATIDTTRLRSNEHNQFMEWTKQSIEDKGAENLGVEPQFTNFVNLLNVENDTNREAEKSLLTAKINDADDGRDKVVRAVWYNILGATYNPQSDISAAGEELKIISDKYGNLVPKPLAEETAAINNFLLDINKKNESVQKIPGLSPLLVELKSANKAVDDLMMARLKESSTKSTATNKEARLKIDGVYFHMMKTVNSRAWLSPTPTLNEFIALQNSIIKRTEEIVNRRLGKKSSRKSENNPSYDAGEDPTEPTTPTTPADPYPNAREWSEDIDYQTCASGDIFYIIRNGVKEYYKLLDFGEVTTFEPGMDDGGIWERLS